jgi:cell surface protein SprA
VFLFYVATNFGFFSQYQSQVNKALWVDALFHFNFSQINNLNSFASESNEQFSQIPIENTSLNFELNSDDSTKTDTKFQDSKNFTDSNRVISDSLSALVDTVKVDSAALDSTARMKYFKYQREDKPYVELKQKKSSKFFAQVDQRFKTRSIQIDSTGQYVEVVEKIAGQKTKIILRMKIDDYIQMRIGLREREIWESIGYAYELKDTKKELGELIKDITNLEIPLPSVGVLSIFGEPKISLRIGGAVDIHGAWRSETTEGVTASRLGNTRNEPDFKQQVQINVSGTIGDKLNIVADWNTERTFEYENQLKIKYTGYEDELIQSIEAGNVSLQTSPLVGGSEALFGIKANFKVGPLSLTTIASQKKGEVKEVAVSGGTTSQTFEKRAYEYSPNHYFIDTIYASQREDLNLFQKYYDNATPIIDSRFLVKDIEVWKSIVTVGKDPAKERLANALIDLPELAAGASYDTSLRTDNFKPVPGQSETGRFRLLTKGDDYQLNEYTGFITFNTQINTDDIIAVAYRVENGSGAQDDGYYGDFIANAVTDSQRLVLKLVKPANLQPGGNYAQAWKLQLKNIYPVGGRNIKKEGFEFQIKYELSGQDPVVELPGKEGTNVRLLNAFGFDNYDAADQPNPDNIFDWRTNLTIIPATGEIIFPFLEPFGQNIPTEFRDSDSLKYQLVYDTTKTFAQQQKVKDKWILTGKYSGEASSVYQLGFNVVENSVRVRLSGRELSPGSDYIVDYNIGQLTIRNEAALVPGADLKITYEQNDLFQLASKTLLGARGIFDFSPKTKLGFSILNLNQETLSDKVRIGEEPLSNTIYGVDFSTSGDLPFITKLLDKIISTKQMSSFSLQGEFAYINPDPNTKKSTIVSDQGKSIAYIDDFEGAKRIIPVGVSYTAWKDLSPPEALPTSPTLTDQELMDYKAKSFWFTATPSNVTVEQIWGDRKQVAKQDENVTVMDYVFVPDTFGTYNYFPTLEDPSKNWGGIMKLLSSTASNLVEENIGAIEFWLRVEDAPANSKVYLDLGRISEDVIPNRKLDTEDIDGNDAIDTDGKEDTGIDGLTDDAERITYGSTAIDPSGDNFTFTQTSGTRVLDDYFKINGTQGNAILSDIGRLPDTEDLNRNGNINLINSFFRYEIPLDTNAQTNRFIAGGGGGNDNWFLYRIPIKDTLTKFGEPSFTTVEAIRFFVTGVESRVHLRFAEFNLVGNQWQKVLPQDTVLGVSVISYEDNPEYEIPPGVLQERDRTRPDEEIYRNEQSLNLIVQNLPEGESREAVKYLYRPLDVFNYKEMKLFIHGDQNVGSNSVSTNEEIHNAEVFFRFGTDTNNYYEYRQPVRPGWNEIKLTFADLAAIKQARDSTSQQVKVPVPDLPGHFYIVKGIPTLTQIKFLTVGIYNTTTNPNSVGNISGEVWINELRVIGAEDSPGWAYSFATSVRMADLLSVNFNMSQTDPYFHRLADRFGSRVESRNWAVSGDLDVLKILPINLPESNLRVNYSHSESVGKPLYLPGTDVKVEQAAEQLREFQNDSTRTTTTTKTPEQLISDSQTMNVSDTWSLSNIKLKVPTQFWLIRDSFNAITMSFNYNKTFSRSPTVQNNKGWIWNGNLSYGLNLSPDYFLYPANIPIIGSIVSLLVDYRNVKLYFTPQNISLNVAAKRNRNVNVSRPQNNINTQEIVSRDFTTSRGFNFSWKITEGGFFNLSTSYNLNINSSLAYLETDQYGMQRSESEIWEDIFSGTFFGKDYQYQQSMDFRTAPRLPSLWDINKFFTITAGYSASYQWSNDFRQEIIGRGAGYSNKFSTTLTLKLKSLMQPLFQETPEEKVTPPPTTTTPSTRTRGRERAVTDETKTNQPPAELPNTKADSIRAELPDSLMVEDSLLVDVKPKTSPLKSALRFLVTAVKVVLFDYETINFSFSSDNNVSKTGIAAKGTGFYNFWGFSYDPNNGPSRQFMLGLNSDVGPRAPNGNLQDVFSQRNNFDFKTSRPLWEGAKLDLNWKVGWSMSKSTNLISDANGHTTVGNITSSGTTDRSFLTFPPTFFLSIFNNGIQKVNELYDPDSPNPRESLSEAFVKGFESIPILANLSFLEEFANYIPRVNWRMSWDGLENFFIFKSIAKRVSLNHEYRSGYTEGWKLTPDGNKEILTQRIDYAFSPLAGFNFTFSDLWGGNLISSVKYSTRTSYDLGTSTRNITETFSRDIGITAGFSKSGFELPLFGVSLKNDIEFTFSYNSTKNSTVIYDMNDFTEEGTPKDGTVRTTFEPRIKYTISSKVTLSIFYRRSSVEPEGAARIPPTTTNEAGLDVHISIQ